MQNYYEDENIFNQIKSIIGNNSPTFNILEEQIDIDLQLEYFEYSKNYIDSDENYSIDELKQILFEETAFEEEKKTALVKLAIINDVAAYRTIERFVQTQTDNLKNWALLAFQESRMLIESTLLDEKQVFISTGLGGKGSKLRYFVVLTAVNNTPLNDIQKKIIKSEFDFALKKNDSELEEIVFDDYLATLMVIVPLNKSIRDIFKEAAKECNLFGNFLNNNFIVTNVKALSTQEIKDFLLAESSREKDS